METSPFVIGAFGAWWAAPVNTEINAGYDPSKVRQWIQQTADFAFWSGALAGRQAAFEEATRIKVN